MIQVGLLQNAMLPHPQGEEHSGKIIVSIINIVIITSSSSSSSTTTTATTPQQTYPRVSHHVQQAA
jgi:hypothetical protein